MQALALEYGEQGIALARERGLAVLRGDARSLPIADQSLDLVVAFDVLEHIDDDSTALAEMVRVLKPEGYLVVAVPAGMDLWSAHDDAVGHVRRYSAEGLAELAAGAGLEVRRLRSWNVLLRRVAAARRRRLSGSHLGEMSAAVNGILKAVIVLERRLTYLQGRPGMSLIMVAHRKAAPARGDR
jgi:SAM-dependent methyltransferase